jgi:hypothetical protein
VRIFGEFSLGVNMAGSAGGEVGSLSDDAGETAISLGGGGFSRGHDDELFCRER